MADDLRNASNWAEIDRLSEKLEDIITEIEELYYENLTTNRNPN